MNNNDSDIETTDVRLEGAEEDTQALSEESGDVLTRVDAPKTGDETATASEQTDEEKDDRSWVAPVATGAFLVAAIVVLAILLLANMADEKDGRRSGGRGGAEQGEWRVTSYSIGGKNPTGKHGKPPKTQAKSLETLVRRWHDSVYLFPAQLRSDTQRYFTDDAARAMRSSSLGLPGSAAEVETKKRSARIGIEADGAKRAAAVVDIVATGDSAKGAFRVRSETHLWFERQGSKWKVIAFDVDQEPLPLETKRGGKGDAKGGPGKGGAKGDAKADKGAGKGDKAQKGGKK